ncbi:MAG: hypothetical protein L0227_11020 [Chloroflexi bacterium]|nr:hypothetical protein [Chloroflexota bacterium]
MTRRVWVEADGIGIAVHFDDDPDPEAIAVFEELCRWIAAHPETLRATFGPAKITPEEAAESGERQLERIESLRRRAGLE